MEQITFKDILQKLPPGHYKDVADVLRWASRGNEKEITLQSPDLQLFCDNENCKGIRLFTYGNPFSHNIVEIGDNDSRYAHCYIEYQCQNCKDTCIGFFFILDFEDSNIEDVDVIKVAEYPFYGPRIPSKLISLIGPDRELFLNGCKCEAQSLGIGAFTYYRRVIENQKNRLLDTIISVLTKTNENADIIEKFNLAKNETQFTKSISSVKDILPKKLYVKDVNPLPLLYKAFSVGIHSLSDDECLEYAHSTRVLLVEFSERLSEVLKDQTELTNAINNLKNIN